jgi:hypothetical protein
MPRIEPTVGRVLLYHTPDSSKPLAAMIANVNEDGTINIGYLDSVGTHHSQQCLPLIQDTDGIPTGNVHFCTWMPYQLGQAARTEQAEAAAKTSSPIEGGTVVEQARAEFVQSQAQVKAVA